MFGQYLLPETWLAKAERRVTGTIAAILTALLGGVFVGFWVFKALLVLWFIFG